MPEKKRPVKICRVAGREFRIYREFDKSLQVHYLTYPDFTETPMYTDEGRPFTRSDHADCPFYQSKAPEAPMDECGDCAFFHREETPIDVIGVCMCDTRKRE